MLGKSTSKKVGPGTYNDIQNFKSLRQKPCPVKIKKSVLGEKTKNPWYMYIGNSLVFEPEFTRSFKPKESERASVWHFTTETDQRPWSRMWNTIHSTSIDFRDDSIFAKLRTSNISVNSKWKSKRRSSYKRK